MSSETPSYLDNDLMIVSGYYQVLNSMLPDPRSYIPRSLVPLTKIHKQRPVDSNFRVELYDQIIMLPENSFVFACKI